MFVEQSIVTRVQLLNLTGQSTFGGILLPIFTILEFMLDMSKIILNFASNNIIYML